MFLSIKKIWLLLSSLLLASLTFMPCPISALDKTFTGADGAEMVLVPEGEFIMGLKSSEPLGELNPLRKAYLKAFYIDVYEVTNVLYHRCVKTGACSDPSWNTDYPVTIHEDGKRWYTAKDMDNYPVVGVTWRQSVEYCNWAGRRLPSNAEWEKAARGVDGRTYPWGDEWDGKKANWDDGGKVDGFKKVAPVGSFPEGRSPYGAMDMAGNVREWTAGLVLKGGSWYSRPLTLRAGDPGHDFIVERDDDIGFRCAMDAEQVQR
jgi:formylglycine-generating enzyme required for sulfatase activity